MASQKIEQLQQPLVEGGSSALSFYSVECRPLSFFFIPYTPPRVVLAVDCLWFDCDWFVLFYRMLSFWDSRIDLLSGAAASAALS